MQVYSGVYTLNYTDAETKTQMNSQRRDDVTIQVKIALLILVIMSPQIKEANKFNWPISCSFNAVFRIGEERIK